MIRQTIAVAGAAALAATLGGMAAAEGPKGSVYLGFNLGAAWQQDFEERYSFEFTGPLFEERLNGQNESELATGAVAKFLLGFHVTDTISLELESSARAAELEGSSTVAGTGFAGANVVFHVPTQSRVRPYVGFGLGSGSLIDDDDAFEEWDSVLSYQVKGGFVLPVGQHHGFVLEASYVGNGTFEWDDTFDDGVIVERYEAEIETNSFDVSVGYRFYFGGNQ